MSIPPVPNPSTERPPLVRTQRYQDLNDYLGESSTPPTPPTQEYPEYLHNQNSNLRDSGTSTLSSASNKEKS